MTKKKVLSILLIICMLMSLMPTFAFADEAGQPGQKPVQTEPAGTDGEEPIVTPEPDKNTNDALTGGNEGTPGEKQPGEEQPADEEIEEPAPTTRNLLADEEEATPKWLVESVLDAAKNSNTKEPQYFYNVLFANGQDVTVAPATPEGEGLLVTVGEETYTFANSNTKFFNNANADGLTIFAGSNGTEASTAAAVGNKITIESGAKVSAIFGGGYEKSTTDDVTIEVANGAEVGCIYGGGLTQNGKNTNASVQVDKATIIVDGTVGLVYAGGRAAVGPGIGDVIQVGDTAMANNWVGESNVTINGHVREYYGSSFSYGGIGTVNCTVNGKIHNEKKTNPYSAVCGANGYCGEATMTVTAGGEIGNDLYCSMRGYVGNITLNNAGTIKRVSLNPDGEKVSSLGNVKVINTGTIEECNLDCGCAKAALTNDSSAYPAQITVDGNVEVTTVYWESNKDKYYTAQEGQIIVLQNGAKIKEGEVPPTNVAAVQVGEEYLTLADAFAQENVTSIKLISDCAIDEAITVGEGKDITLDLNGHSITCSTKPADGSADKYYAFEVNGGKLKVTDTSATQTGQVIAKSDKPGLNQRMFLLKKGELNLDKGKYETNIACVVLGADENQATPYSHLTVGQDAQLNIDYYYAILVADTNGSANGVVVDFDGTSNNGALYINGTVQTKTGNVPVINVGSHANVTVTTSGDGAVYAAGYGIWNFEKGCQLTGDGSALAIKAGIANINGGTFKATGKDQTPTPGWSNGVNGSGAAIQIESNNKYAGDVEIAIKGGTITSENGYSIYEYLDGSTTATKLKSITVDGGDFTGAIAISEALGTAITSKDSTFVINNGYFTSDPSAYLADGKVAVSSDKAGYNFMVGDKPELPKNVDVDVAVAASETKVPETITDKDEVEKTVKNVDIPDEKLAAAAGTQANNMTKQEAAKAVTELEKALNTTIGENVPVLIVIQPYMEIEAVGYTKEDDNAVLTLNITPMYKTVATTATDASDIKLGDTDKNAVVVGTPQKLQVTAPVEITIPLPAGFTISGDTAYVKHTKDNGRVYYHKATVTTGSSDARSITFTNDKGFSTFEVSGKAPKATVKFEGNTYKNSATYDLSDAQANQKLPTDTKSGYTFDGWQFDSVDGTYTALDETLLSKLAGITTSPIKATPVFHSNSSGGSSGGGGGGGSATVNYTITATAGDGGKISPSDKVSVTSGSNKTFTITANAGYMISDVLVDGESVGAVSTYTFEKVTKAHTIKAEFTKTDNTGLPFTDVSGSDWFYAPVKYVYDQKLMVGVADDQFGPYTQTTRGMIVTMLWRMAGEPQAQTAADFTDVAAGDWYAKAIDWAAEKGIVNGYGNGAFGPNDPITREQLAAIFCNYAKTNGKNVSARADLSAYSDQPSQWAESAMQWAVAQKLISGKGNGVLDPTGQATRAEAAAILMRYVTTFGK